jgi:hypothetical protein
MRSPLSVSKNAPARLPSSSGPGPCPAALPPAGAEAAGPGTAADGDATPVAALTAPVAVPPDGTVVLPGADGGEDRGPVVAATCGCPPAGLSGVREGVCPGDSGGAVPDGGCEDCCDGGRDGCGAAVGVAVGGAGEAEPGQIFSGSRLPGEQGAAVAGCARTSGDTASTRAAADA